jgi:hypothetical protein
LNGKNNDKKYLDPQVVRKFMLEGNPHKKRSNCKKRVLDSKNAQDFEKCSKCSGDVQTSLVTPQTSSPLCRGKNTL